MKKVYVASPVAHYIGVYGKKQGINYVRRHALEVSKQVKELGHIPISLPLMFCGVYAESKERDLAMRAGLIILSLCDAFAYRKCDLILSEGMREELEEARLRDMEIIEL